MNPIEETTMDDRNDRRLDLLVDGELDENDRRELLRGLDREPDGWRRCAMAFLEAQTWKQALGAIVPPRRTSRRRAPAPRSRPIGSGALEIALADGGQLPRRPGGGNARPRRLQPSGRPPDSGA